MYFPNYGVRETLLNKCLNSPVSDDPLTSNTVRTTRQY